MQNHHIMDGPYFYNCEYYHNWQDHRRKPYLQGNAGQLAYSELYVGDGFSNDMCNNWMEYQYHPHNYKKKQCETIEKYHCHLKFCPKIHNNFQSE